MSPVPVAGRSSQAIGLHSHISITPATHEESFLAGLLENLRALCAFCLPSILSYDRLQPNMGGEYVAWGTEDRRVPIRKISPGHWELRCVDATANMYLAFAVALGAGLLGLEENKPLKWGDTALPERKVAQGSVNVCKTCTAGEMIVDGSKEKPNANGAPGALEAFPSTLETALDALGERLKNGMEGLNAIIGSGIIRHYLDLKKFETLKLRQMDPEIVRQMLVELF